MESKVQSNENEVQHLGVSDSDVTLNVDKLTMDNSTEEVGIKGQDKQTLQAITEQRDGKLIAIASDETIDRVGDSIKVADWDFTNFLKNPVLQAGHDYKPQCTIGIAENIKVEGRKVMFTPKFHKITQLAREIGQMYQDGFLKAWSVGFIPAKEKGKFHELLEISAVAVPANPNALTSLTKSFEGVKDYNDETVDSIKKWIEEAKKETVSEQEVKEVKKETEATPSNEMIQEHMSMMKEEVNLVMDKHAQEMTDMSKPEDSEPMDEPMKGLTKTVKEVKGKTERWNTSLSKAFDVENLESVPSDFEMALFTKFLECQVKNIYYNSFEIPSPLMGSYLSGLKTILSRYELKDTRSFSWGGTENPPMYEVVRLNSTKTDDFLINGVQFLVDKSGDSERTFVIKIHPSWGGLMLNIVTANTEKEWNKSLLKELDTWVSENNLLKGELFALNGEFLEKTQETWDDVILQSEVADVTKRVVKQFSEKGVEFSNRGMMFIGEPGNGKTKTGRVIMNSLEKTTLVWVTAKDFERMGSSYALSLGFSLARSLAPAILFVEDVDTWLGKGTATDLLKTEMDGLRQSKGLLTILTSNAPEALPDALLDRPGRFHDILNFENPNSELRKQMLNGWLKDLSEATLDEVVKLTEGYSGAYMWELVQFSKSIVEDEGVTTDESLMKSLEKLRKQRELIDSIKDKNKSLDNIGKGIPEVEVDLKEGRVLSSKNRKMIQDTIAQLDESVTALEKLLAMSEPPEKGAKGGEEKGRIPKVAQKLDESSEIDISQVTVRALQRIAKNSNYALNRIKSGKSK